MDSAELHHRPNANLTVVVPDLLVHESNRSLEMEESASAAQRNTLRMAICIGYGTLFVFGVVGNSLVSSIFLISFLISEGRPLSAKKATKHFRIPHED